MGEAYVHGSACYIAYFCVYLYSIEYEMKFLHMNSSSRIPVSVRISQEEADFIATLQIDGANTPSEKIRELLRQARLAHEQHQDYSHALDAMERFLHTARHRILHAEKELGIHSTVLARLFELLPDLMATTAADIGEAPDAAALKAYEREMMWRIVRLTDAVLQLAVTGKGVAYDDRIMQQLDNTLKLAVLVAQNRQPGQG